MYIFYLLLGNKPIKQQECSVYYFSCYDKLAAQDCFS